MCPRLCRHDLFCWTAIVFLALATADACIGQEPRRARVPLPQPDLRVDVDLAIIPVSVTDTLGVPVDGLVRENFRLFEDVTERPITFLAGEDLPASVCLVFDLSLSMRDKMRTAGEAVVSLLAAFDHPDDEFCLVVFNERPRVSVPLTRNVPDIERVLARARPLGGRHCWMRFTSRVLRCGPRGICGR